VLEALSRGADPNAITLSGQTAVFLAAHHNHWAVIKILAERGALVNLPYDRQRFTALHIASLEGSLDATSLLVSLGAHVNRKDQDGWTPLLCAAHSGCIAVVDCLLANGADATIEAENGRTTLSTAIEKTGEKSAVAELIRRALRKTQAATLMSWMLAMSPLRLPICTLRIY
jgi:ankyrin repeat protein